MMFYRRGYEVEIGKKISVGTVPKARAKDMVESKQHKFCCSVLWTVGK